MTDAYNEMTICFVLRILYLKTEDESSRKLIEAAFIKAKKMNQKLVEYKGGGKAVYDFNAWLKELKTKPTLGFRMED